MQQEELKELLNLFDQSTLTEFDLKDGSFELYFNKTNAARSQSAANEAPAAAPAPLVQTAAQTVSQAESASETPTVKKEVVAGTEIVSPIVGVVYLSPAPDKPDFKKVGDQVKAGEVVCIVEAMKVMNEITSDVSGEIVAVAVENEQVVEYNQPLFRVKEG